MKIKQYLLCGLTSATLLILGSQNDANANLKNQFKQSSGCSWETAKYQWGPNEWGSGTLTRRYCITGDKRVKVFFQDSDDMQISDGGTLKGFIGQSEGWFDSIAGTGWNQSELSIEGDELVNYSCAGANAYDCGTSTLKRKVLGTKSKRNAAPKIGYVGDTLNNKKHGKGTYTWANGDKYVGDYVNDKKTGKGTYYFANGDKYEGDWVNNKFDGYGKYTYSNGYIEEGRWSNDEFVENNKLSESNNINSTNINNSDDSTVEKPNFQNLEKDVKGMFKNFF